MANPSGARPFTTGREPPFVLRRPAARGASAQGARRAREDLAGRPLHAARRRRPRLHRRSLRHSPRNPGPAARAGSRGARTARRGVVRHAVRAQRRFPRRACGARRPGEALAVGDLVSVRDSRQALDPQAQPRRQAAADPERAVLHADGAGLRARRREDPAGPRPRRSGGPARLSNATTAASRTAAGEGSTRKTPASCSTSTLQRNTASAPRSSRPRWAAVLRPSQNGRA